jgi:hypothetical protein
MLSKPPEHNPNALTGDGGFFMVSFFYVFKKWLTVDIKWRLIDNFSDQRNENVIRSFLSSGLLGSNG